ncbi:MAG: DUF4382 domain-containing protein [Euryarchaeota archaeon]|nr:DUF4382 domain-containing protein [Euryarchaeota archaeon]
MVHRGRKGPKFVLSMVVLLVPLSGCMGGSAGPAEEEAGRLVIELATIGSPASARLYLDGLSVHLEDEDGPTLQVDPARRIGLEEEGPVVRLADIETAPGHYDNVGLYLEAAASVLGDGWHAVSPEPRRVTEPAPFAVLSGTTTHLRLVLDLTGSGEWLLFDRLPLRLDHVEVSYHDDAETAPEDTFRVSAAASGGTVAVDAESADDEARFTLYVDATDAAEPVRIETDGIWLRTAGEGGWVQVGTTQSRVDLGPDTPERSLVVDASVPAGRYDAVRLGLGAAWAGSNEDRRPLEHPATTLEEGLALDLAPDAEVSLVLTLDLEESRSGDRLDPVWSGATVAYR